MSRALRFVALLALALLACALPATAAPTEPGGPPAASAAAAKKKSCARGKVAVRRPGRAAVCAKRCPTGKRHKVNARGKVSCVSRRAAAPAPQTPAGAPPAPGVPPAGPPAPAPAASGPSAGRYGGTTEQSRPVGFTVAGGQVTGFEAGVNTYCTTQGNQRVVLDALANIPPMAIGPDGSFSYTGDESNGNAQISGRITGTTATGTVGMSRGDSNYVFSDRQTYFGSCSASDVKWTATVG